MAWKPIIFAGCGPGAAELVTPATWMAALSADRLLGPPRLLDLFPGATSDRRVLPPRFNEAMAEIARAGGDGHAVTILFEGDAAGDRTVARMARTLGLARCRVLAGVSVASAALARLGLDGAGARVIDPLDDGPSGDPPTAAAWPADDDGRDDGAANPLIVFAGSTASWAWTAALAERLALTHNALVCENLSLPGERLSKMEPFAMRRWSPKALTTVVFVRKVPKDGETVTENGSA